jgi:uroporphyrin-III C-methyltransferase
VLTGASDGAVWKAELLLAAGADLHVYAGDGAEAFADLLASPTEGSLTVHSRIWSSGDLSGAALAIGDIEDRAEAEAFVAAARLAGCPVNIVDKPEFCDFSFGSLGRATLVGAGPGDPELLTLKAVSALQSADVILYDDLVGGGVLELARREAKRMLVGKTGHGPSCKQSDINALMVALALQGKHVVRLKSGDPGIFGRAGEEIEACNAAGIPVTLVPGISAAQGAAANLGISLTHRDHARRLQFVTGHGRNGLLPDDLDWTALADPRATTAIYMPRATLGMFRDRVLAAGLTPHTPAITVVRATRPDETRVTSTIAKLPEHLAELPDRGPMLVLMGWSLAVAAAKPVAGSIATAAAPSSASWSVIEPSRRSASARTRGN